MTVTLNYCIATLMTAHVNSYNDDSYPNILIF